MTDALIFDHVRTPRGRGRADGSLHAVTSIELATQTLAALKQRNHLREGDVDDVPFGIVMPVGEQGQVLPRLAALQAGLGQSTSAVQVCRFCGSGLEACNIAAAQVISGQAQLAIGGGVESMSRVPMMSDGGAYAVDPQVAIHQHTILQGVSADLLATRGGYSRRDVDAYAVASHQRAAHAAAQGYFKNALVTVRDCNGVALLDRDETIRPDTSVESLGALKPSFVEMGKKFGFDAVALQRYPELEKIQHVHHAGNSSGIVDGAGAVLIGSRAAGEKLDLRPRARFRSWATIGSEPTVMLTGPVAAADKALKNAGMTRADIDLWELNEAFAAVVLHFMDELNVAHDTMNVNGGAIALGHPMGATGAMILGTVLDELERRDLNTALITLCIAAGMGIATIIERV